MPRFFADSCFFIGLFNSYDHHYRGAREVYTELLSSNKITGFNDFLVSDLVLIETFQKLQNDRNFAKALEAYNKITHECRVLRCDDRLIQQAIAEKLSPFQNRRTQRPPIGLTDGVSLVLMDRHRVRCIISFDDGFDHIPLTRRIYNRTTASYY